MNGFARDIGILSGHPGLTTEVVAEPNSPNSGSLAQAGIIT